MVKFEGIVNGQKFDNVRDYNNAVKAALRNGTSIQASSRTYSVEDEQEQRPNRNIEPQRQTLEAPVEPQDMDIDFTTEEWIPRFDLDELDGTEDDNEKMSKYLSKISPEQAIVICNKLDELSHANICKYAAIIRDVLNDIIAAYNATSKAKNNIDQGIASLSEQKKECNKEIRELGDKLRQAQEKLIAIEKNAEHAVNTKRVCNRASHILTESEKFFTIIAKEISIRLRNIEANRKPFIQSRERPGKEIDFGNIQAGMQRFLQELFGKEED